MLDIPKSITVIGLGYIGLPTAALLASKGYIVNGIDTNKHTVDIINKGEIHIIEPDLDAYVQSAVDDGKLRAYLNIRAGDVYIICVPTPFHKGGDIPTPNIDYVISAAKSIIPHIKKGDMVILESTSPVGTTNMIQELFDEHGVDTSQIFIAYCPERVLPGQIMTELVDNARVIGGIDSKSTSAIAGFYRTFVDGEILETHSKTAEMCKLTENSFRDVNIAFANELSVICDNNGVDVWELIKLANHHPRVNILQPGTGVGGHCIAVDPWFIVSEDPINARIIRAARTINDSKPDWVVEKIKDRADSLNTNKIACLGMAFKPDIDDLRESPAMEVINSLIKQGYEVSCVEPNISYENDYQMIDLLDAVNEHKVIAILVKHKEFVSIRIRTALERSNALDFCGVFDQKLQETV